MECKEEAVVPRDRGAAGTWHELGTGAGPGADGQAPAPEPPQEAFRAQREPGPGRRCETQGRSSVERGNDPAQVKTDVFPAKRMRGLLQQRRVDVYVQAHLHTHTRYRDALFKYSCLFLNKQPTSCAAQRAVSCSPVRHILLPRTQGSSGLLSFSPPATAPFSIFWKAEPLGRAAAALPAGTGQDTFLLPLQERGRVFGSQPRRQGRAAELTAALIGPLGTRWCSACRKPGCFWKASQILWLKAFRQRPLEKVMCSPRMCATMAQQR